MLIFFLLGTLLFSVIFVRLGKNLGTIVEKTNTMSQEKTRYSDTELIEFKELIQNKLKEAHIDYTLLVGSLSHNDDHGTDDTGRTFNMMEDGSETLSREGKECIGVCFNIVS